MRSHDLHFQPGEADVAGAVTTLGFLQKSCLSLEGPVQLCFPQASSPGHSADFSLSFALCHVL